MNLMRCYSTDEESKVQRALTNLPKFTCVVDSWADIMQINTLNLLGKDEV